MQLIWSNRSLSPHRRGLAGLRVVLPRHSGRQGGQRVEVARADEFLQILRATRVSRLKLLERIVHLRHARVTQHLVLALVHRAQIVHRRSQRIAR